MVNQKITTLTTIPCIILSLVILAKADNFNQKTILIGNKGAALGGAFTGLADDATATYYNPAGLTQIQNVKLDVSAQIIQYQKQEIQIAPNTLLPYNSLDFSPSITCFSQRMGNWAYGFSIVTPQNDLFRGEQNIDAPFIDSATSIPLFQHINLNYYEVNKSNLFGPSLAFKLGDNISIGITTLGVYSTQIKKTGFEKWTGNYLSENNADIAKFYEETASATISQNGLGFDGIVGVLIRLHPLFSIGIRGTPGGLVWIEQQIEQHSNKFQNDKLVQEGDSIRAKTEAIWSYSLSKTSKYTEWHPPSISLGFSWQIFPILMMTGQADYLFGIDYDYPTYSPIDDSSARSGFEAFIPQKNSYSIIKSPVLNLSGGLDLRLNKVYSLTVGGYTDISQGQGHYDSNPKGWNRSIHYLGATCALGIDKQYTESRFGVNAAWGQANINHLNWIYDKFGKPQILANETDAAQYPRHSFYAFKVGIFMSTTLKI